MAELIYLINASLDGYIADENGEFDWAEPSDDTHAFFNEFQQSVGTVLNGRRMYETMRVWDDLVLEELPKVQRGFAEAWRASEKIVYSSTMDDTLGPRARLERIFDPEAVRAMKHEAARDLSIAGPNLAAAAIEEGLVDRYVLRVVPAIVGGGTPALPRGVRVDLSLNRTSHFEDGSVVLDYRVR